MGRQPQDLSQFIASFKNKILYQYFDFRINRTPNPYGILFRKQPYKTLFILSHMRSGSSLLTHILNSNSIIIGYGETHLNYSSEADIKALQFKVYWQLKDINMNHEYLMDKILHDHKIVNESILNLSCLRGIFLIRRPEESLPSIINIKPHWSEEKALNYYCQRLQTLGRYAEIIGDRERCLFLTHDQLLHNSRAVFAALKEFLQAREEFSEEYQILKTTGMRGVGDSSETIKMGKIIKDKKPSDIPISLQAIARATAEFSACHEVLSQTCMTIER